MPNLIEIYKILLIMIILMTFWAFVNQDANAGNVSITWEKPTQREDGSALNPEEIGGYRVYYSSVGLERVHEVEGDLTETVINELFGLYDFQITTVDSNGLESKRSDKVSLLLSYQIMPVINLKVSCQAPMICIDPETGAIYNE